MFLSNSASWWIYIAGTVLIHWLSYDDSWLQGSRQGHGMDDCFLPIGFSSFVSPRWWACARSSRKYQGTSWIVDGAIVNINPALLQRARRAIVMTVSTIHRCPFEWPNPRGDWSHFHLVYHSGLFLQKKKKNIDHSEYIFLSDCIQGYESYNNWKRKCRSRRVRQKGLLYGCRWESFDSRNSRDTF